MTSLFDSPDSMQSDPAASFATRTAQLAQRRKLAEQLVAQGMQMNTGAKMVGPVYTVGNALGPVAQMLGGAYMNSQADKQEAELALQQRMAQNDFNQQFANAGDISTQSPTPELNADGSPVMATNPSKRDVLMQGDANGLRTTLAQQFMKADEDRRFRTEEAAAKRLSDTEQREQDRLSREAMRNADREAQIELRKIPTSHITINQGGAGAASDGKPLTNAQEKAALELGGELATMNRLASGFKDEYSGDLRSTLQREWGKAAGGAASKKTQDMTRWWSDQAMFDELPTRHELFGAALTATEQKSWKDAAISPNLSPDVIKERLATRRQIMNDAASRMRASAVAGGKSGKQFDAATGMGKPTAPAAGRTKINSKAEYDALPAGAKWEMPDGRKGTK
jgi:hypothetical protein